MQPYLLQFLLMTIADWLNRKQEDAIEYLRDENRVLREQLGGRRLRFSNDQRRRLAAKATPSRLGRSIHKCLSFLFGDAEDVPLLF